VFLSKVEVAVNEPEAGMCTFSILVDWVAGWS
jgi:hypothetical protein